MRRLAAATSILAISLLAVGGSASATLAQDASSTTAESPVVGAWLLDVGNDTGSPPTTAIFHADGTYIQTDGVGTGIGSWAATGASACEPGSVARPDLPVVCRTGRLASLCRSAGGAAPKPGPAVGGRGSRGT